MGAQELKPQGDVGTGVVLGTAASASLSTGLPYRDRPNDSSFGILDAGDIDADDLMVDVSEPSTPTVVSSIDTTYHHKGLQSVGHYLYYSEHPAGEPGGLRIYDFRRSSAASRPPARCRARVDVIVDHMTFPTSGTITVLLPGNLFDRWLAYGKHWGAGIEVLTSTKEICVTGAVSATIGAVPMVAGEGVPVGLRFEGPVGLEFEMAIREAIDGVTSGGVAYQWVIPELNWIFLPIVLKQ